MLRLAPRTRERTTLPILAADASRGPALLVARIHRVCALLAPWPPGTSTPRIGNVVLSRALTLAAVLSAGFQAPPPPDFSGRWTLDAPAIASTPAVPGTPAATARSGDMGSGWGSPMTLAQIATQLTVQYTVFSRYDLQPPLTFTYPLDGSEGRNAVNLGRGDQLETSRATWKGQQLVIVTTFHVNDRSGGQFTAELTRTLSLESPTTLVVEVTRAGVIGGPASTTRTVYRKG